VNIIIQEKNTQKAHFTYEGLKQEALNILMLKPGWCLPPLLKFLATRLLCSRVRLHG